MLRVCCYLIAQIKEVYGLVNAQIKPVHASKQVRLGMPVLVELSKLAPYTMGLVETQCQVVTNTVLMN